MKEQEWQYGEGNEYLSLNFTRCQRPDGSYYGTGGQCRKGAQVEAKEKLTKKDMAAFTKAVSGRLPGDGVIYDEGVTTKEPLAQMKREDQKALVKELFEEAFSSNSDTMDVAMNQMKPETAEKFGRVLQANGGKIPANTVTSISFEALKDAPGGELYETGIEGKVNGVPFRMPGRSIMGTGEYEYGFEVG